MTNMWIKSLSSNSLSRCQQGAAAVELAVVIVVLLLIVAGIIGFGRAFWYADALTKSARDGARLLSTWPAATISSLGVVAAQVITRDSANSANVSPQLTTANVLVKCDYSSPPTFVFVDCVNATSPATAPANVRVSITGFKVNLDEWFPFMVTVGTVPLAPHTTMRYMN